MAQTKSTSSDHILTERNGAVWHLRFNRPHKANAYNALMLELLGQGVAAFDRDPHARVLLISGHGRAHFCAGADLEELADRGYEAGLDLQSATCFNHLANSPKVTIAAINGAAIGGGMELALACDLRVCSETAVFRLPETNYGLMPAAGGTYRLPAIVGMARAKEIVLGGMEWNARQAYNFGLVSKVVEPNYLINFSLRWAGEIASKNLVALRLAKQALSLQAPNAHGHAVSCLSEALLYELKLNAPRDRPQA